MPSRRSSRNRGAAGRPARREQDGAGFDDDQCFVQREVGLAAVTRPDNGAAGTHACRALSVEPGEVFEDVLMPGH